MSKTHCTRVKLKALISISEKAYLAESFNGEECILPKSCVLDYDLNDKDVTCWISSWILPKKEIQYSDKIKGWFNSLTGKVSPHVEVVKHIPESINAKHVSYDTGLFR